jgi:hypothetical protein
MILFTYAGLVFIPPLVDASDSCFYQTIIFLTTLYASTRGLLKFHKVFIEKPLLK